MAEVIELFPTPFLRAPAALDAALVDALAAHYVARAVQDNNTSPRLSHTEMVAPGSSALLQRAAALIAPKLINFGALLFGERLPWRIKAMWVNVLDTGGHQAMHNHANSFVSGVVYLSNTHEAAQTVFMKSPGGSHFAFKNDHAHVTPGPFSADKWISPAPSPGDLVLFPSYLMHAVPPNPGPRRVSLAFNAVPERLGRGGEAITFV